MNITYAVIALLTLFAVYQILRSFGVFEFKTQPRKVATHIQQEKRLNQKRRAEKKKLEFFASVTNLFHGILMPQHVYEDHVYYIKDLN